MEQVSWMLEVGVREGQVESFHSLMRELVEATREKEPGTLTYEWYTEEDGATCHVWERFASSEAALAHLNGLQPHLMRFMEVCEPRGITVYGSPSDEVRSTIAAFGPRYFGMAAGYRR